MKDAYLEQSDDLADLAAGGRSATSVNTPVDVDATESGADNWGVTRVGRPVTTAE